MEKTKYLNQHYKEYVLSKVGNTKSKHASDFCDYDYYYRACKAISNLGNNYDLGIALATGGLFFSYIAEQFEFPTMIVKMSRHSKGATWQPVDDITRDAINDKRIVVFENDVVTGRTLRRAIKEINFLNPLFVDLLLVYEGTLVSHENYEKWEKFLSEEVTIVETLCIPCNLYLDTMCQIPKGFRKVMTLEDDFEDDLDAVKDFEQKIGWSK